MINVAVLPKWNRITNKKGLVWYMTLMKALRPERFSISGMRRDDRTNKASRLDFRYIQIFWIAQFFRTQQSARNSDHIPNSYYVTAVSWRSKFIHAINYAVNSTNYFTNYTQRKIITGVPRNETARSWPPPTLNRGNWTWG